MNTDTDTDVQSKILEQLEVLNERTAKHNSLKSTLVVGMVYGIGFFIGSAILATIALGIFGPWFAEIDWVKENFERGSSLQ